jgi:hypothetical protein
VRLPHFSSSIAGADVALAVGPLSSATTRGGRSSELASTGSTPTTSSRPRRSSFRV